MSHFNTQSSAFWDRFKCCGSEDNRLFASCSLEHKINRIRQHDYCITPLTRFNSQTGDNSIMDGSVFCTRSMGWCELCFLFIQQTRGHRQACYFCCQVWKRREGGWKRPIHSRGAEGGSNLTHKDKRKRSFTKVNFAILHYVAVFLFLTNGTNINVWIASFWGMFMLLLLSDDAKALGEGTRS